MPAGVVTLRPTIAGAAFVTGKYVCDATPALTYIDCGFVPSYVRVWNVTDKDQFAEWSTDMADGTAMNTTTAAAAIASGGITPIAQTNGTHMGFTVGTDASVQEASKTFGFMAFR